MVFVGFLVAAILCASAGMKIRMDRRTGMGTSPATLAEMATAGIVAITPVVSGSLPVALVALAFLVSVIASFVQVSRHRAARLRRAESEGGRLAAYVRYLSTADEGEESDDRDPPAGEPDH